MNEKVTAVIQRTVRTDDMNSDSRVIDQVLVELLDDLTDASPPVDRSNAYLKGYSAGIRFARICVLDEMALKSGSFVSGSVSCGHRRAREQVRTRAALATIAARLSRAVVPGQDDGAAGHREAIATALQRISQLQRKE